mmetsp:Transcript_19483/g.35239  ORF Transcript_19483/g.35239 Transcript_19483/m.35239 type:complete len:192 (+) Transcript_19483:69-644(+)|eukprot:CAMPEP_0205920620 /NCGR_PEP_ID=MMETSP1325-20131115/11490_1 /ASSEMBLY_ACC=CAM_ASM_000708 /TAXON_ID=236786 /ORGANISM="Florenciella sp., Strain RCC1007" /LENGTH=191 /DNA_ID=CAMNT_0053288323 /DNA_START=69 /DNA_END=644 /DNA_ORIENTATION=-
MDTVLGIKGDGFTLIAADRTSARSIMVFNQSEDKITELDSHKIIGQSGPQCDTANFAEYIQKNMTLYELNNDMKLSTFATANFMRRQLATALRKGPYQTNILLGGFDENAGASLYFLDMYSALTPVNFGAHGYASNFCLSIFDREYKDGMSVEEAKDVIDKCIAELHTRFLISQPNFLIKIVDKDGVRVIE